MLQDRFVLQQPVDVPAPDREARIAPRLPFFTPVIATGLEQCWMTNISAGGVGLTGIVTGSVPQRGDDLEIEFSLGPNAPPIRAVARIAWTSRMHAGGRCGFGLELRELSQRGRTQLALFLAEHRPRVLVGFAPRAARELVEACLDTHLDFIEALDALDADLLRTTASIILFANDMERMGMFLDALDRFRADQVLPIELPFASVTVVTTIDSERLLPLLTAEKIYEVLRPPLDRRALVQAIERSCERWALKHELRWASLQLEGTAAKGPLRAQPKAEPPRSNMHVVRVSAAMQRVHDLIKTVAVHDVPVLLAGETGTGKELAAREIHSLSRRAETPFIAQDCGALTETLLESELFGHVKGAFTGATNDHPGLFQIADGGTIFLDEIQNTSPALQAKLLRVVEEGEVRPVGSTKTRRVNVRLIAACNVDLKEAVAQGRFRSDFYYRLNRFPIELPALRDHVDDILPLTRHFITMFCTSLDRPVQRLEQRAEQALLAYRWPGNIRELKNAIERALLLTPPPDPVPWETLPDDVRHAQASFAPSGAHGLDARVADVERRLIEEALVRNNGIVRRAARELAVNSVTLSRKMKKLGITA